MSTSEPTATGKFCASCKEFKLRNDFRKDRSKCDGLRCSCRNCECRRRRESYRANHEKNKHKRRKYYQKHRDKIIQSVKASYRRRQDKVLKQKAQYREQNRETIRKKSRTNWWKNHERLLEQQRAYSIANRLKLNAAKRAARLANPEKEKEIQRRWRLKNPEKLAQLRREGFQRHKAKRLAWERKYRRTNVNRKISASLRNRLNAVLRGNAKTSSVLTLLGYALDNFKEHFQSKFTEGMSWEKFLAGEIHIDHIIPCADFDLSKEKEQRSCFNFSNLQPLWARDNLKKGAKRIQGARMKPFSQTA